MIGGSNSKWGLGRSRHWVQLIAWAQRKSGNFFQRARDLKKVSSVIDEYVFGACRFVSEI